MASRSPTTPFIPVIYNYPMSSSVQYFNQSNPTISDTSCHIYSEYQMQTPIQPLLTAAIARMSD
jgi:hypothetical protein